MLTRQEFGISVIEATLAMAIMSFILLASLNFQASSLSRLGRSKGKYTEYLKLSTWKAADLSGPECSLRNSTDGITFIFCSRTSAPLRSETSSNFVLQ